MIDTYASILGKYGDMGYRIEEDGDHSLLVYFKELFLEEVKQTAYYLIPEAIQRICQEHFDLINGLADFG